ncbi:MAG: hypothetical protein NZX77_08400 [Polyangiaceae bacterium]|nr:hypothetical protein [Polyangiaceae bacterium]
MVERTTGPGERPQIRYSRLHLVPQEAYDKDVWQALAGIERLHHSTVVVFPGSPMRRWSNAVELTLLVSTRAEAGCPELRPTESAEAGYMYGGAAVASLRGLGCRSGMP